MTTANTGSGCWHCNTLYGNAPKCPSCGATNPNVDLQRAIAEQDNKELIVRPSK